MASIQELKRQIDIEHLAEKFLGLKRGNGDNKFLWHSPAHKDATASLSIFTTKDGERGFKDWSNEGAPNAQGSIIDLVIYSGKAFDTAEAMKKLHEWYSIPFDTKDQPAQEKSLAEHIADKCYMQTEPTATYLLSRGISLPVIESAIKNKTIGFNDWTSTKAAPGEQGHGGPAAAFIVKTLNPGRVVAVDLRYIDPALNGGNKTTCQGEKLGYGWTSDIKRLLAARTVYITESPINALSVETAFPNERHIAAFALRGVANINVLDWGWARGKQIRICLDHTDKINERTGFRPGLKAAWDLHEALTALDIPALFVDQHGWDEGCDLNDKLQADGAQNTARTLKVIEEWLIPGLTAKDDKPGKKRVYLPAHDSHVYWKFRVKDDHTQVVTKVSAPTDDEPPKEIEIVDLCGFRVASLSRVTIQSASATMTGDPDSAPNVQFSISVQVPRHGPELLRRVFADEDLHNVTKWEKFGPIYSPANFKRMVNVLERTSQIGSRRAVNFVGLAWRDGQLTVNEGTDCYFTDPEKQCPYSKLIFPSGQVTDARVVIEAFGATMKQNAALLALVWGLGGHLKAFLGFWPHMQMQANKSSGKSTVIKKLERAIAFTMLSGQSLQTEFRLLTSISHTSHPIGWEELSARNQEVINKAVGMLQENYQHTVTRRGSDMTEYLLSAPVMLAGEDVPIRSLIGKIVRTDINNKKGTLIPNTLPRFPVKQWLQFLSKLDKTRVNSRFEEAKAFCLSGSRAPATDDGAMRMTGNYAALLTAWKLLAEFAGLPDSWGGFPTDLLHEMNLHIGETDADREPWVWIMEIILSELAAGEYRHPYQWSTEKNKDGEDEDVLCIRTGHIMDHISGKPALREKWNGLPVKSDRVLKKQLSSAGVILKDGVERSLNNRRIGHMTALSLKQLERFGLHATPFKFEAVPGQN